MDRGNRRARMLYSIKYKVIYFLLKGYCIMKHTFLFSAGLCVAAVLAINSAQAFDYYQIKSAIKKETLNHLVECSSKGNKKCQLELGFAYLFGEDLKDTTLSINIEKASELISSSTMLPYSRYLLGMIYLKIQKKINIGMPLIQSACVENIEDACVMVAMKYAGKSNCNQLDKPCGYDENINRAIRYEEKAIYLAEKKLENKKLNKIEVSLIKSSIIDYKIELAEYLIKNNNPKGVSLLESFSVDDIDFNVKTLARVYEEGKIVPRDLIKSYMYYDLTGITTSDNEDRKRLQKIMTLSQLHEAQERSWNWQEQHHSYRPGYRNPADYDF